jgi:DNA-3-methyladenine glycosylase
MCSPPSPLCPLGLVVKRRREPLPDAECGYNAYMAARLPDPQFCFDPDALGLIELPRAFYLRRTVTVARALIGKWFARRYGGNWYGGRIVETEAYLGSKDAAAHSWRERRTPRVEPMYLEGGHLYVFFVYGMHACANIVTRPAGIAEAVLLRAAEGPPGAPWGRMSGPGRLCSALGIDVSMSGADLLVGGDVRVFRHREERRLRIGITPRIGVDYAGDARLWPLRFFELDSPAVSGPARLRE